MKFLEIVMNKKHFLFLLPVCLMFCLWFTTCDEEAEEKNLWEKIRNTVWTNEKTLKHNGEDFVVTHTLGFFKPSNGPYPNNKSNYPYVVIRFVVTGNVPEWWEAGVPYDRSFDLQIDRTGNIITSVDKHINYDRKEFSPSFHLSVSGNGEKLSVSGAKLWDIWDAERFVGTYKKVTSGSYNWGNGLGGGGGNGGGGGGSPTTPNIDEFFGTYAATYMNSPGKIITEIIQIDKSYFRIEDNDPSGRDYLYFDIIDWESDKTPPGYFDDYPKAFKITGRITDAKPQVSGYLYGSKTAQGFTSEDISNGTTCWMYLYFDYDYSYDDEDIRFIRTAFSKAGNLNENVYTDNNMPRVYRRR